MPAVPAVPAAVRLSHPAAARRAVLTLLFLGGFLALAFVFGAGAQADSGAAREGRPSAGAADGALESGKRTGSAAADGSGKNAPGKAKHYLDRSDEAAPAGQQPGVARQAAVAASHVAAPVAEGAGRTEEVTRPIGETVGDAAAADGLHQLPGRLGLDGLADGVSGGEPGGSGDGGADGSSGAAPGEASGEASAGPSHDRAGGEPTGDGEGFGQAAAITGAASATAAAGPGGFDEEPSGRSPLQRTPAVPAPGASQHAGDGQSQRGGPQQPDAVVCGAGRPGPLQPGAASAADGTLTRDRAGDVLQFPG